MSLEVGTALKLLIPRTVRKNLSHRAVPGRGSQNEIVGKLKLSSDSRWFRAYVKELCKEQKWPKITEGAWAIEILAYWETERTLDDDAFPNGDVDAPISPVLDALEKSGHIDNDVRFGPLVADHFYDPVNPRIEITIERWR